jgi:uncharacterized membrane protein
MDDEEYRERLAHDVATWTRAGLISAEQEGAILARTGAGAPRAVGILRLGWFVTAVSIIGALVLAGGVVLLFASQWDTIPTWLRTGSLFGGMVAAYGAGYALIYRFDMQRVGSALLLLGVLLYEAALFLTAEIYNMPGTPVDSPLLLLLAAAGALPLAYLFQSRIVLLLGIANATGWVIAELAMRYPDSPKSESVMIAVGAFGVGLYAVGQLHLLRASMAPFSAVYRFAGLLVLLALVYAFTFDEVWRQVIDSGVKAYSTPAVVYATIGLAAALVAVQALVRARDTEMGIDIGAQAVLLAVAAVVATWPGWSGYALVFNGIYFAIAAALVTSGYLHSDERFINLGLAVVGLGLITRYIDLFWSMLAGSAFFIIGGVLLLGVAFAIERMRSGLIRGMATPRGDAGAAKGATP